jgi:pimeloyl-ACP methyl ester carboxylesterase
MGHSFGGLFMQLLLDRGLGVAGVGIDAASPEGIRKTPPAMIKATFAVLENPANRHRAVPLSPKQFHYAFCNNLSEEESAAVYERYHVAAPGRWVWDGFLANLKPGHQDTWVNFHNDERAPLLLISGGVDHTIPASVVRSNLEHYNSAAHTDYREFEGPQSLHVRRAGLGERRRLRAQLVQRAHRPRPAVDGVTRQ